MHKVSIIILSYNTLTMTKECIESIRRYTPAGSYEIIVIDNASTDNSVTWLKKQQDIKLLANTENKGFPGGCNQGMAMAEAGNDILLLNSDTIVTPRWLDNLSTALYSSDDVGAVSCVTSSCSYGQQINIAYKNYVELMEFAEQYNHSNPDLWEQRPKLIGFCYLIKNSIFQALGGLDERFTPGNFEDDDYSVRVTLLGKKLLLCKDTFIHHYGSASFGKHASPEEQAEKARKYNALIQRNLKLFMDKWQVTAAYGNMHNVVFDVQEPETAALRILVVGCNAGMDLCYLQTKYPNATIHGIATNQMEARLAGQFFPVGYCQQLEKDIFDYLETQYDYILLSGSSNQYVEYEAFVEKLMPYLTESGSVHIETVVEDKQKSGEPVAEIEKVEPNSRKMVAVVVPVYQEKLNMFEEISLKQANKILGNYDRIFVAPESLLMVYGDYANEYKIERFPDKYFTSVDAYSRLMLTEAFYQRFSQYEYILIYQTDAFVFKDELAYWCQQGYDYIGAPVYKYTEHWHALDICIGNGGFSLRNVAAALRMLLGKESWIAKHPFRDVFEAWEDMFWGYCGKCEELDFKIPDKQTALRFAVQDDISHAYRRIKEQRLPVFGCHGWWNKKAAFWTEVIRDYDYDLSQYMSPGSADSLRDDFRYFCVKDYCFFHSNFKYMQMYYHIAHDDYMSALKLGVEWLEAYPERHFVWLGQTEKLVCLLRLCVMRMHHSHKATEAYLLSQLLLEALRRCVLSGVTGEWKLNMLETVLDEILDKASMLKRSVQCLIQESYRGKEQVQTWQSADKFKEYYYAYIIGFKPVQILKLIKTMLLNEDITRKDMVEILRKLAVPEMDINTFVKNIEGVQNE